MKVRKNSFNEIVTTWESYKHPDNLEFNQVVFWTVWEKPNGKVSVAYSLGSGAKPKFLFNISKEEAINKFS